MKKNVLLLVIPAILLVALVLGGPKIKQWWMENQTKAYYTELMENQGARTAQSLLEQAQKEKKARTIQLIIFKRTCPYCQKEKEVFKKKVEALKAKGDLILVVEAPQKGIIKSYPSWLSQFEIPQMNVPARIEYRLESKASLPLRAKQAWNFNFELKQWQEVE